MRERLGGKPLALGPSDSRTTVVIQTVEKSHFVKKKYKKRKFPPWGREKKENRNSGKLSKGKKMRLTVVSS
jgi:hypothetical protein